MRRAAVIVLAAASPTFAQLSPSDKARADADALLAQALVLDEGKTVARDPRAAAALYQQAADLGDAFARYRLGYLYEIGDGVAQDYAAARANYQAAVAAGSNEARVRLALCYLEGWGGPMDRSAFAREMRTAAEAGDVVAQRIMASVCILGLGVPRDPAAAVRWLERAAAQNDPSAEVRLGMSAEAVGRKALLADMSVARTWYQRSAEQEYVAGMQAMARSFLTGERAGRNIELGLRWLQLATDAGDPDAPLTMAGVVLLHPDTTSPDEDRARELLTLARSRGNFRATEVLDLESGGLTLTEAMRYFVTTPQEERYVKRQAVKASDAPTRPPQAYQIVDPIFPRTLRLTETTGEALVDFIVDKTGRVVNAKVASATHPLFGERAVEAVRQWRFYPGRHNGVVVATHLQVPIKFLLGVGGIDDVLMAVGSMNLSPAVLADAIELSLAKPKRMPMPVRPGKPGRINAKVMLLLVLDADGNPIRGHILRASPDDAGLIVLQAALQGQFVPRVVNGMPVASNVVLVYTPPVDPSK